MRIVQLANLVTPTSGGIRTVLDRLGRGYVAAGHDVHRIVPADRHAVEVTPAGVVHHLPGVPLPYSGGYRVLVGRRTIARLLDDLDVDRIEVSDRFTLRWVGTWARHRGVPATVVVHERLEAALQTWVPFGIGAGPAAWLADGRLPGSFDTVVVPSAWAAGAFRADNVAVVPLGVDLRTYRPGRSAAGVELPSGGRVRLVSVTRLSREKQPALAIGTLRALRRRGLDAELHVVGDGPQRRILARQARDLPVTFHGFVPDRRMVAALVGSADAAVATCPIETFGLATLEALACGTPVVAVAGGALAEVVAADAGIVVTPDPSALAAAVIRLLERDQTATRVAARARAEAFPWSRTVDRMLTLHRAPGLAGPALAARTRHPQGDSRTDTTTAQRAGP